MKSLLLSLICLLTITAFAQNNVTVRFDHKVGDAPLELDVEYTETEQAYNFSITRLQYYVSEIVITHDGGQTTEIADTWLLVNAAENMDYDLGMHNIDIVEGISYFVGVDQAHNHLDPTQYESGHPLAPQNPVMHWGWAAGYRFTCLEGKTGMNLLLTYQIHALGDANYNQVSFETGAFDESGKLIIPILADYMGMYNNIDVSSGLIEHSETGDAITLLENLASNVFSPMYFTGLNENKFEGAFAIGPNPATNGISNAFLSLPSGNDYTVSLVDLTGRLIKSESLNGGNHTVEMQTVQAGIYFVQLSQNGETVETKKLIVTQ